MSPSQDSSPALSFLATMRSGRVFRHARFERRKKASDPAKLVIGIGQVHGVGQGRFERFQARRIATVQAWIFHACSWLTNQGIYAFGQEGFSRPGEEAFYGRMPAEELQELQSAVREPDGVLRYLKKTARNWRKALKRRDGNGIQEALMGLNALNILQALDERIGVFPIEQKNVHGALADNIRRLHDDIARVENSAAYQSVRSKQGRGLTQAEYDSAIQREKLVKAYNACLQNDQRNDSIFEEVMRYNERQEITVFVLGQAHRSAMLHLAKQHLPSDTMFVWITPAPLWRPVIVRRIVIGTLAIAIIAYMSWLSF